MKRTIACAVLAAAMAALLCGCGETIAVQGAQERELVTVSASDSVKLAPDKATVSFGVTTEESTAEKAQVKNSERVNEVIAALVERGVDEKSIRTENYNMYPRYDYSGSTSRIVGYTVYTTLSVQDRDIEGLGELLSACVAAGINRVDSVGFFCSGYDEAYREALKLAVDAAREKAETLAAAAGRTLGGAVTITEGWQDTSGRYPSSSVNYALKEEAYDLAAPAFQPGESEIKASVTVAYELK
ncbi:MAG: SIMPL domain-containing protein [Oscillibacter sp.]|nr:SIMPL domain-containing protein [Oscillibacter sp.]